MKITPDYEGRNDGYDKKTVRYFGKASSKGYFYELYVLVDGVKSAIIIDNYGVSVDFITGESIHTNIIPHKLFPGRQSLTWKHLRQIVNVLEGTSCEGKVYSRQQMETFYKEWKQRYG